MSIKKLREEFVTNFSIGEDDEHHLLVENDCIAHPLFVFPNFGRDHDKFNCVLPRSKWGRYFGSKVGKEDQLGPTQNGGNATKAD